MNKEAIFSDGSEVFVNPPEPAEGERVCIRIRLAGGENAHAYLCTGRSIVQMRFDESVGDFDFFKTTVNLSDETFAYYFMILSGGNLYYYDRYGISNEIRWQYAFRIVPGFSTPEWSKGAVMYQILVDRFCNGDTSNDVTDREYYYITRPVTRVKDWDKLPSEFDVTNFYGGDLAGVAQKLYYLKSLGVEVIYFNPLFVSPSNHKYDTQDYDYIDPHYGKIVSDGGFSLPEGENSNSKASRYIKRVASKENLEASNRMFADFVEMAHEKGIKVILDGVFNHCGSFNKWLDRERIYEGVEGYAPGAFVSRNSPYHNFFYFHSNEDGDWPYNRSYDGWWGHDTLPKLNYEGSAALADYILQIGKKWVSPPYNCDGWRLDVAADLGFSEEYNHNFWRRFRDAVKEANPKAIILAEHYGDASGWLAGDQWDTIMNYDAFMEPVSYFLTGMEKHSDRFEGNRIGDGKQFELTMRHCMTQFLSPSLYCSMNQLSNHDHSRFLTRTNHKVGRVGTLGSAAASEGISYSVFRQGVLIQMTWPGAPTLYYGDEAGVVGFTDPDNRRTYPWGKADYELIDFHRDLIYLHRSREALRKGAFMFLDCGKGYISYARFSKNEKLIVVISGGTEDVDIEIPAYLAEIPKNGVVNQIFVTNNLGYSILPTEIPLEDGILKLHLEAGSGMIFEGKV
ncbi:MAG: glycoside hydrolase family 13 protein [Lachnospiraceae bacterium]|nr:glycoside hydrolase family 13 protein [Lachnospiraceae bacterium]